MNVELWYPKAIRNPGPVWKQRYGVPNKGTGVVLHSMVGTYAGAMTRLFGDDRVSWHFSVLQNGAVYQHYPIDASCWHSGNTEMNSALIGVEHEGGFNPYNEPLTPLQLDASIELVRWLGDTLHWPEFRVGVQLWEHNWISQTACPSGRIPWDEYKRRLSMPTVDQELRDRIRAASAFRMAAAAIEQGMDLKTLPADVKNVIKWIVAVSGI